MDILADGHILMADGHIPVPYMDDIWDGVQLHYIPPPAFRSVASKAGIMRVKACSVRPNSQVLHQENTPVLPLQ